MTTNERIDRAVRPFRHYTILACKLAGILAALSLATLVSWNLFVPELFDMPSIRMREAVGIVVFAVVLATIGRRRTRGHEHD